MKYSLILQAKGKRVVRGEVRVVNRLIEIQMSSEVQIDLVGLNKTNMVVT